MMMGEFQHNMDAKGRVAVPFKFRMELGEKFYVSFGTDSCLFLLPGSEMEAIVAKLDAMSIGKGRNLARFFLAHTVEVEPDKQGRIVIPQNQREHAGLDRDVTIIGSGRRAEIWDTVRWQEYSAAQTDEVILSEMAEADF